MTPNNSQDQEDELIPNPTLGNSTTPEGALDFMWQAFSNLNEWVRFSDSKAAAVLAADGVILGAFASLLAGEGTNALHGTVVVLWLCSILVATFYSACYALWSLLPQLKVNLPKRRSHPTPVAAEDSSSLVFFMDIDKKFPTSKEFHDKINEALHDPAKAVQQISQQVWANSKVAAIKYSRVEKSLKGLVIAVPLGFIGVILLSVTRLLK